MGCAPKKMMPLTELILGKKKYEKHPQDVWSVCPVCDKNVYNYYCRAYYLFNRTKNGLVAHACPSCFEWFNARVEDARRLRTGLRVRKMMLISTILCRDIVDEIMRLYVRRDGGRRSFCGALKFVWANQDLFT
jgi:hypothetical protein